MVDISEEWRDLSSSSVATLADKRVAARAPDVEQRWQSGFIDGEEQAAHRRDMKYCEITFPIKHMKVMMKKCTCPGSLELC